LPSLARRARRNAQRPAARPLQTHQALTAAADKLGVVPVSVTLIVKDCADSLARTLQSLRAGFMTPNDEIVVVDTGSQDGGMTVKVARDFGCTVVERPDLRANYRPYIEQWLPELKGRFEETGLVEGCILDFAAARQAAMDAAQHDIQFWIDSDDVLEEQRPYNLRRTIDKFFREGAPQPIDAIFMDYFYWTDPSDGSCTSVLKRERVIDRRIYHWAAKCHETAIQKEGLSPRPAYFHDLGARIRHLREAPDESKVSPADIRNYIILRKEIEDDRAAGRTPDPRTVFYLGNAARGVRRAAEAIELYQEFLPQSGSRDDRYAASYYIAIIYLDQRVQRPYDSLDWAFKCIRIKPEDPRGYFALQRAYHQLKMWDVANHWYEVGRRLPEPVQSLHNYDPRQIHVLPHQVRALTAIEQKDKTALSAAMDALIAVSPNHEETKGLSDHCANWMAGEYLTDSIKRILANTGATGDAMVDEGRRITEKLPDLPAEVEERFLAHIEPPPRIEVAVRQRLDIFCGKAIEPWGPRSGDRGIGGSEKAVIQMAPRLQARGFQVNVYANVPKDQRGVDMQTGVNWQHYGAYDFKRERDTCIFWRAPEMLENRFGYRKRIVWLHDVQNPAKWTDLRCALADEVWALTEFHATTLGPAVRAKLGSKLWITRNGIDTALIKAIYEETERAGARNPKRIIYASSPDRGVRTAMEIYELAKKQDPDLQLHVLYGFNKIFVENVGKMEYAGIPDLGRDAHLGEYWQDTLRLADRLEVAWHGRVGWAEVAAQMCASGIWLYPTRFAEISCMSAMEAAAGGCVLVHSGQFALAETLSGLGVVVDPDKKEDAARKVVEAAQVAAADPSRRAQHEEACRRFSYDTLADEWVARLQKD
jgi:glycosyltransferase involved in cell wall biosynthesis